MGARSQEGRGSAWLLVTMVAIALLVGLPCVASNVATQVVHFEVRAGSGFSVEDAVKTFSIDEGALKTHAESQTPLAAELSSHFSFTAMGRVARKMTAQLEHDLPQGVRLQMIVPGSATQMVGQVTLRSTPADVLTDISHDKGQDLAMRFLLSVAPGVQSLPHAVQLVYLTLH